MDEDDDDMDEEPTALKVPHLTFLCLPAFVCLFSSLASLRPIVFVFALPFSSLSLSHTHSRSHTHTHTHTHSLTHSLTHSHTHSLTHSLTHLLSLSCKGENPKARDGPRRRGTKALAQLHPGEMAPACLSVWSVCLVCLSGLSFWSVCLHASLSVCLSAC
jgi:hypothetical protein